MKISDAGLDLIKSYESLRLHAYMPTPDDVPTIGYGHTKGVQMGDTCTEEQALAWLRHDCAEAERCVARYVTVPLTQGEYDSLCSLIYNIGCGAFSKSTLLSALNDSNYDKAESEILRWDKQNGKTLLGLSRRRQAEVALFRSSTPTDIT